MLHTFFIGEWTFERKIFTGENVQGTAKGTAIFEAGENPTTLIYSEKGELRLTENNNYFFF